MRILGELCLLGAFVASGYAAFACAVNGRRPSRPLRASGVMAALASLLALTLVMLTLSRALIQKDFRFAYVAEYSSEQLSWQYSLSALWVGQAGSLLLWSWFSGVVAFLYGFWPRREPSRLREGVFAVLMAYACFLVAIMVFAADPMEASITAPRDGAGLSPLLQHPAMLIHPPVVFLGYTLWTVPFALAAVALVTGQLDTHWVRQARPWALSAWAVLGAGILLGADWAYEELGWGGYWGWDPVENGSLIPWLTGTALMHALMTWQYRGQFKKTAIALAIATFGLCNFATFLTRSGIFSSLHAFSKSPIGWLFLALMLVLALGGGIFLWRRRGFLRPDQPIRSVFSREAFIVISSLALLLLTAVTLIGTLSTALSNIVVGRPIMVGPAFYNYVLIPTGFVLLATTSLAPLLRWGAPPTAGQMKSIRLAASAATVAAVIAWASGLRNPMGLLVAWLAVIAVVALLSALLVDAQRRAPGNFGWALVRTVREGRRQYAGFLIHMGFVCLVIGVAGSSLGTHQQEFLMREGESVEWAGHTIRLAGLRQHVYPDKLVGEAELHVSRHGRLRSTLRPAQHFHRLQQEWTTEVAIQSTWGGDLYTILHTGDNQGNARLTFVHNPMMRWLWLGGWIMGVGTLVRLWPAWRRHGTAAVVRHPSRGKESASKRPRVAAAIWFLALTVGSTPWLGSF